MAKRDLKKGRFTGYAQARFFGTVLVEDIEREFRGRRPRVYGIRQQVLDVYHSRGILEAYQVLEEYNKKFENPVYSRELFEKWIAEENKRNKSRGNDDGYDR